MNNGAFLPIFWQQLSYHGPMLFVLLVAAFFAFMFMSRASLPSILTLIGVAIWVISIFGMIAAYLTLFSDGNLTQGNGQMFQVFNILASFARAVGLGFLVVAIFVGRNKAPQTGRYLEE